MRPAASYRAARREDARIVLKQLRKAGEKTNWRAVWAKAREMFDRDRRSTKRKALG
jgi:hypothetical protein